MWEVIRTATLTCLVLFLLHHIYDHLQVVLSPPVVEIKRKEEYEKIEKIIKPEMEEELADFMKQLRR
jgi:hypothetical protein